MYLNKRTYPHRHINIEIDPEAKQQFVKYCNIPGHYIEIDTAINELLDLVNIMCLTHGSMGKVLEELDRYVYVVHEGK